MDAQLQRYELEPLRFHFIAEGSLHSKAFHKSMRSIRPISLRPETKLRAWCASRFACVVPYSLPTPVYQVPPVINFYVKAENEWIYALAIALEDINRLSLRPLKWLRFVVFTVVGARGDLFDYKNVPLANIAENDNYYFASGDTPHCETGNYHFADPQ